MSFGTDAAHTALNLTLDPDTGAIRIPDIHYHPLKPDPHQTRVMGLGTASACKSMRLHQSPLTRRTTELAPPDQLLEEERLPTASKGSLLPYTHLFSQGKHSTPSSTSAPVIGPSATHSVISPNEAAPNVPGASTLLTWPEDFSPATSLPMTTYPGCFPVSNELSPEFQGDYLPRHPQYIPTACSPSTERSVAHSPTASSPPPASSCPVSSCRHPVQVEPELVLSNTMLHAFVLQIFSEPWFINGQTERSLTVKEASSGLGFAGKSVFLAFASRLRDGTARVGKWRCLICDTLPDTLSDGKGYTSVREDRILKHIRHHFRHRPWLCGGQCGMGECSMKFLSKEALDSHRRSDERARCDHWCV